MELRILAAAGCSYSEIRFGPLFRSTFAMYGGLSTKCMAAGNLFKTCNRLAYDAVAKLAVGHVPTIRVGHVARHVRYAAAP